MLRIVLFGATAAPAAPQLPTAQPGEVGMSPTGLAKVGRAVQSFVDDKQLAGAVTIVARKGEVVYFEAHGMRDIAGEKRMRKDTIFRIYSMTKAVVSVAAMILVEEGKLELDAPAAKYVPALGRMKVGGKVPQRRAMTLRDLLRHSAGFPNNVSTDRALRAAGHPSLADSTLEEMMNRLDVVPLRYHPGEGWHYSFAADVVARLVEIGSGQTIDTFLAERIFEPLGMVDTGFYCPPEKRDRFATVHGNDLRPVDAPQPGTSGPFEFSAPPKFLSGGGGLVSTAEDYMRFCLLLSNKGVFGGTRLLRTETVEMMSRDQLPPGVGEISRRPEGRGFGLGFAVRVREIDSEPSSTGEYEWLGGAGTEFWLSPKEGLAVITLSQQLPMRQLGAAIKPLVYDAVTDAGKPAAQGAAVPPREKYLLLDQRLIAGTDNARLAPGTVRKSEHNPLFVADEPWEPRYDNMYPNVIYDDEEEVYKCWYCPFIVDERTSGTPPDKRHPEVTDYMSAKPNRRDEAILYATSRDGIHWVKPELGIVEFDGSTANNIVVRGPSGAGVYKDPHDPDPARRYKAFYAAQVGDLQLVRFSPDGLHWGPEIACPEIAIQSDCHANMIWSPERGKYIGIVRHYDRVPIVGNRKIARTESVDGLHWTKSTLAIAGTPQKQAHDMVLFQDGGIYLGLLGVMHFPSLASRDGVRQHIELAWSPDSATWHRIAPGTPLIDHTPAVGGAKYGAVPYDWGAMFPSPPVFRSDGAIEIFYGASDWFFFDWRRSGLALATLGKDRWAGYEAIDPSRPATVRTTALPYHGGELVVTADIEPEGSLHVRLVDDDGGDVLMTSEALKTGGTDIAISWSEGSGLDDVKGSAFRLRFELEGAKLYAFRLRDKR